VVRFFLPKPFEQPNNLIRNTMEKFTRIISIDGNYAYNTIGETFYVTNDLLPMQLPCVISYNPEWTSSINRIMVDSEGEELYYTVNVRHAERAFGSTEQLAQYRKQKWNEDFTLQIVPIERLFGKTDFSELVAF
jgi:hypothetical protein